MAEHWRLLRDNVASVKVCTLITGAWCIYTGLTLAIDMFSFSYAEIAGKDD